MENKSSVKRFFSWKSVIIAVIIFFVLTMAIEYLIDRKDYPSLEVLFQKNALRKGVMAVLFGVVMTYFRAKQLQRDHEANAE